MLRLNNQMINGDRKKSSGDMEFAILINFRQEILWKRVHLRRGDRNISIKINHFAASIQNRTIPLI